MSGWPGLHGGIYENGGADTTNSVSTTVAAGTPAHTKGSWVELIASTGFDSNWLRTLFSTVTPNFRPYLADIGIGASSSEQVLVENVMSGSGGVGHTELLLPIHIPAGTRISARAQCAVALQDLDIQVGLSSSPFHTGRSGGAATTYGAATGDSGGVEVDPGTTVDTKGAWSEISASTSDDIQWLYVLSAGRNNAAMSVASWLLDIGVGGAGSEQVVIADTQLKSNAAEHTEPRAAGPFPVYIPAGSRLAARSQCSITTGGDRLLDFTIIGVS